MQYLQKKFLSKLSLKSMDFPRYLKNSLKNLVFCHKNRNFVPKNNGRMRYKIKKENKTTLPTCGKYKAVAVHNQTIDSKQLVKEVSQRTSFSEGNITGVLMSVAEVVNSHLREGDKVRLPDWGMMKLEITSDHVDSPKQFKPRKHIRGVRLHFLPESYNGKPELYQDIQYEKVK